MDFAIVEVDFEFDSTVVEVVVDRGLIDDQAAPLMRFEKKRRIQTERRGHLIPEEADWLSIEKMWW